MFGQLAPTVFFQFIFYGELKLGVGDGTPAVMRGAAPRPAASIHLADSQTLWRIVIKPDLAIGEAYMQGKLRIDNDDLEAFIHPPPCTNGSYPLSSEVDKTKSLSS